MHSQKLTIKDENFVVGGTTNTDKNAGTQFLKTGDSFKCNCGMFECNSTGHLDTCADCIHSVKTSEDALCKDIYCSKQSIK